MTSMRRGVLAVLVAGSMAGGALGATVINAATSSAATTPTTTNNSAPPPGGPGRGGPGAGPQRGGKFVPNENPTHEKTESAQREAQENAGQVPTVP
jgi:Spy/CpxP family protein refolding chaperone